MMEGKLRVNSASLLLDGSNNETSSDSLVGYSTYIPFQDNNNCCWLYSAAIVTASSLDEEGINTTILDLKEKLAKRYSAEIVENWFIQGIPFDVDYCAIMAQMGLNKLGGIKEILVVDEVYNKEQAYQNTIDLLNNSGSFIITHPAVGSECMHQSTVVGVFYGRESINDEPDVYLVLAHTQHQKYTAIAITDLLELITCNREQSMLFVSSQEIASDKKILDY